MQKQLHKLKTTSKTAEQSPAIPVLWTHCLQVLIHDLNCIWLVALNPFLFWNFLECLPTDPPKYSSDVSHIMCEHITSNGKFEITTGTELLEQEPVWRLN